MSVVASKKPLYETLPPTELQTTFRSQANALQSKYSKADNANNKGAMNEEVQQLFYDFKPLITTVRSNAWRYNTLADMCTVKKVIPPVQASPAATQLVAGLNESQIRAMLSAGQNPVASAAAQTAAVVTAPTVPLADSSLAQPQSFWEWAVEKVVEASVVVRDGAVAGGTAVYDGAATGASAVYNGAADSAAWMQSFVTWAPAEQQDVRAALQERLAEIEEKKS
jgi:hypothetical protein